jgi:hypothetical protein
MRSDPFSAMQDLHGGGGRSGSRYVAAVFMLRNHLKAMTDARTGDILAT